MIIFGSRSVYVTSKQSTGSICPSCGTKGSLRLIVFRRHVHVFWIPIFPIGKKGMSQCQHCKHVLNIKEMPEPIKQECITLKNKTKGPIWQFAGLGILIVMILWAALMTNMK
ncbi:hypothetical protein SAMN04487910_1204 [Aquimarina amphilecti]|uniref:Zinc-ribbon 15 domain-containing protein n=1 Tax=Aquimarina amphilecti TaxID=1038014 RepID=A0A1H7K7G5_AQUAM|nr:zinc-ribbon domain-containing protein [Aquimarina amphilecti]SEK81845.1 hypothetical protein SAMN04487910_1204 [Aquimarina amphilecti]